MQVINLPCTKEQQQSCKQVNMRVISLPWIEEQQQEPEYKVSLTKLEDYIYSENRKIFHCKFKSIGLQALIYNSRIV